MSTTASTIIDRARAFSPLNASLLSDPAEILTRINQRQIQLFASIADVSRDRFQVSATLASSAGSSARTLTLTSLALPLERLLTLTVPNGEANQVDPQDLDAEYAPRYLSRGETLVEVGSDWSATSGAVTATLVYVRAPTVITATGGTTQVVTVPDEWIDLLILPLAAYCILKDPGRDPAELAALERQYAATWAAFTAWLTHRSGRIAQRAWLPPPALQEKR